MKKSSYQKLKEKNMELTNQIVTLVSEPESVESLMIKHRWRFKIDEQKAGVFGSRNDKGNGILDYMSEGLIDEQKAKKEDEYVIDEKRMREESEELYRDIFD